MAVSHLAEVFGDDGVENPSGRQAAVKFLVADEEIVVQLQVVADFSRSANIGV